MVTIIHLVYLSLHLLKTSLLLAIFVTTADTDRNMPTIRENLI
jgi:hypothetical protein